MPDVESTSAIFAMLQKYKAKTNGKCFSKICYTNLMIDHCLCATLIADNILNAKEGHVATKFLLDGSVCDVKVPLWFPATKTTICCFFQPMLNSLLLSKFLTLRYPRKHRILQQMQH